MPNRAARAVFDAWEALFHRALHLEELEPGTEHLFFVARRRYLGRTFEVDGIVVRPGDPVVEMHMNNALIERALREDANIVRAIVRLLRQARVSLPALAKAVQHEKFEDAQVLYGITMIHRGIEHFGFHTYPLRNPFVRAVTSWHLTNILKMVNPDADHILQTHRDVLQPKLVVASKQKIIEMFGEGALSAREGVMTDDQGRGEVVSLDS
ncbi:YkoP family protein [Alicyclobacillus acidocaldarius]|uniref:YkoP-like domain-containing protein n=1 Tax=Alicyclobacillus acidocaldarius (strain Tc-4-1) TaxID=1048834 RepID=F8IE79_ALIAT|nr:hypothetical protein [Alicyclobacillus acidocaldarius]AEJ43921.1 hypothetical protein TC41_2009 [Alicyclobacillus acidocaldarius subsp. acidocaldarius Tc-4-1]